MAANAMFRDPKQTTEEHDAFRAWFAKHGGDPVRGVPGNTRQPRRMRDVDPAQVAEMLGHGGGPGELLVVSDAMRDWPARRRWTLDWLATEFEKKVVLVNDRAPARHADGMKGRPQRTATTTISDFVQYVLLRERGELPQNAAPFYCNGWRAFSDFPALREAVPGPYFTAEVDHNERILESLSADVLPGALPHQKDGTPWYDGIDSGMSKLFLGPTGALTRLHYDAGDAHGWLGQIQGRKLFVCFSPEDTEYLYQLDTEKETKQSAVDPLAPDLERYPLYAKATPYAFVVEPGEIVMIPRGWWHYAVALDPHVTAQRNFYHVGTNTSGLVHQVLASLTREGLPLTQAAVNAALVHRGQPVRPMAAILEGGLQAGPQSATNQSKGLV